MYVRKRQAQLLKRLLPGGERSGRTVRAQKQFLNCSADIGFWCAELGAPGRGLIARKSLLQGRFRLTLQNRR